MGAGVIETGALSLVNASRRLSGVPTAWAVAGDEAPVSDVVLEPESLADAPAEDEAAGRGELTGYTLAGRPVGEV